MTLWHYTSIEFLKSILSSKLPTLRATHVYHLNDTRELLSGFDLLDQYLNGREGYTQAQNYLSVVKSGLYRPNLYSFSLSEAEDSLYQWLAYCPASEGISLGFDLSIVSLGNDAIEESEFFLPIPGWNDDQIPQFRKCIYPSGIDDFDPDWFQFRKNKNIEPNIMTNCMFIKHPAFHFEQEHRIFFHPMKDHKVEVKYNGSKPFIEFHFLPRFLTKIYISPRGDQQESVNVVQDILDEKNLGHVSIIKSEIPFRE